MLSIRRPFVLSALLIGLLPSLAAAVQTQDAGPNWEWSLCRKFSL